MEKTTSVDAGLVVQAATFWFLNGFYEDERHEDGKKRSRDPSTLTRKFDTIMTSDTLVTVILAGSVIILTYIFLFVGRKSKPAQAESPKESCPYLESISKVDENGDTKLMVLCGEGDFEGVEKLLQSVSSETKNVHSSSSNSTTGKCPFHFGSSTTTQLKDTFVVDVNAVNDDGETALMFAAENGHDLVLRLLLDTTQGTSSHCPISSYYFHELCPCYGDLMLCFVCC